jgi:hypothetical protein
MAGPVSSTGPVSRWEGSAQARMILIDTSPSWPSAIHAIRTIDGPAHLETLAAVRFGRCEAVLAEACVHLPYRVPVERRRASATRLPCNGVMGQPCGLLGHGPSIQPPEPGDR